MLYVLKIETETVFSRSHIHTSKQITKFLSFFPSSILPVAHAGWRQHNGRWNWRQINLQWRQDFRRRKLQVKTYRRWHPFNGQRGLFFVCICFSMHVCRGGPPKQSETKIEHITHDSLAPPPSQCRGPTRTSPNFLLH